MGHSDELEKCKMEIRSVLITFQKGCTFFEFNCAYKDVIGITLPFRKFGFHKSIEFLYSMPDVVKITTNELGRHHLQAVVEDKTKHIQRMVAKQKPAASRHSSHSSKASTSYIVPSQFTESILQFCETIKTQLKDLPEQVLQSKDEHKLLPKASLKENIIALVQYFDNKIAFDDLLCEYLKRYKKNILFSKYGYASLNECIEDTPELSIETINRCSFIVYHSNSSDSSDTDESDSIKVASKPVRKGHQNYGECSIKKSPEIPPIPNSEYNATKKHSEATIPDYLRRKLLMVAERFKEGILSSDFPSYFKEVTGAELDFHNLGYKCLIELIDDVTDLFKRVPVRGRRNDYVIYSVYEPKPNDSFFSDSSFSQKVSMEQVIVSLRRVLQSNIQGVKLRELLHIYSIYCNNTLNVKDYGFDDFETFLSDIKTLVPLRIRSSDGVDIVYLDCDSSSESILKEYAFQVIPFDVVYSNFKFKLQNFPTNYSKYFPVYVSQVQHAGDLYIQLDGAETSRPLIRLLNNIHHFSYNSMYKFYTMKSSHIEVGVPCIARYSDEHLYRAEIVSIPSAETVVVNYVDYGTRDKIPKNSLKYMKKEFSHLPAQAIKCRLAFLKPPKDATEWNDKTRSRILHMCKNIPLMAKLVDIGSDGVYSIVLCKMIGKEELFINDVLRNEGLADYVGGFNSSSPVTHEPVVPVEYVQTLNTLHAQYFLRAFGTLFPSFAQNENYLNLARQVATSSNLNLDIQNVGIPRATRFGTSEFDVFSNENEDLNSNLVPKALHISSTSEENPDDKNNKSPISVHDASSRASVFTDAETFMSARSVAVSSEKYVDAKSEISECKVGDVEDDNEHYHRRNAESNDNDEISQFCQNFLVSQIRRVKRVMLGDGHKIHVILVDSKLYASSDDIVNLICSNKSENFVFKKVQLENIDIPVLNLSELGNAELFQQLEQFGVKGVRKVNDSNAISLYPLIEVIKILNIFGHPSITVRRKLYEEITNFNPNDPEWLNFSPPEPLEPEENFSQDDVMNMNRLCMLDLIAMEESIKLRRNMLTNSINNLVSNVNSREIDNLLQLHQKVLKRIQEIKGISNMIV